MATTSGTLAVVGNVVGLTQPGFDTLLEVAVSGSFTGAQVAFEGSLDGTNYFMCDPFVLNGSRMAASPVSLADNTTAAYKVACEGYASVRVRLTAISSGAVAVTLQTRAFYR